MSSSGDPIWEGQPPWNQLGGFNFIAVQDLEHSASVLKACLSVIDGVPPLVATERPSLPRDWGSREFITTSLGVWERHAVRFDRLTPEILLEVDPPVELMPKLSPDEARQLASYLRCTHMQGILQQAMKKFQHHGGFTAEQTVELIPVAQRQWSSFSAASQRTCATAIASHAPKPDAIRFLSWVQAQPEEASKIVDRIARLKEQVEAR